MRTLKNQLEHGLALLAAVVMMAFATLAPAQPNLPPTWVFARAYNGWSILGQTANTYTWNGGVCNYSPYNGGNTPSFFVFSGSQAGVTVYYPVAIIDANPAVSEIVTPTSTTQSSGACGFAGAVQNQHTSFQVQSGTAGLQEAIITQQQSVPTFNVILDKYWYQAVAALPGPVAPATIIGTVTGNSQVGIVDTTTTPWTYYAWNGTKYDQVLSPSGIGNLGVTSFTNISAPTLLSNASTTTGIITTANTGGTIPASATYRLGATCVDAAGGETTISPESTSASQITTGSGTATNTISVTSPGGCTAANGAVGWRLYMTAASGSTLTEILYSPSFTQPQQPLQYVLPAATVIPVGQTATITAIVTGTSKVPQLNTAYIRTSQTSNSFPPFPAKAIAANTNVVPLGTVNLPAQFLNSLGRSFMVCGQVTATTGTEGAITLTSAITTAGVVGTNTTLFTAASGATTSTTLPVPFNFCITYTTAAVSTSATSTAGALEVHGVMNVGLGGTDATTTYQDILGATVGTLNLWTQNQLSINAVGDGTVVSASIQLRQLSIIPIS